MGYPVSGWQPERGGMVPEGIISFPEDITVGTANVVDDNGVGRALFLRVNLHGHDEPVFIGLRVCDADQLVSALIEHMAIAERVLPLPPSNPRDGG